MAELLPDARKGLETGRINTCHKGTGQGKTGATNFASGAVDFTFWGR
jgi:hypothetical protein